MDITNHVVVWLRPKMADASSGSVHVMCKATTHCECSLRDCECLRPTFNTTRIVWLVVTFQSRESMHLSMKSHEYCKYQFNDPICRSGRRNAQFEYSQGTQKPGSGIATSVHALSWLYSCLILERIVGSSTPVPFCLPLLIGSCHESSPFRGFATKLS